MDRDANMSPGEPVPANGPMPTAIEDAATGKPLGSSFRLWILAVVAVAFVLLMQFGWGFITSMANSDAAVTLELQLDYFEKMIEGDTRLAQGLVGEGLSGEQVRAFVEESISESVSHYSLRQEGIGALAVDGTVVASNRAELIGRPFSELMAEEAKPSFLSSLFIGDRFQGYRLPGLEENYFVRHKTSVLDFNGTPVEYSVMVALSESEVYYYRGPFMTWLAVTAGALFLIISIVVMRLIRRKVVRNIDMANEVLGKITEGDLAQRVDLPEVTEFSVLAGGINATVGALRRHIDEAQGRIDRELATAKAIQESALPTTFPPFPEVDAFDLYASMKPAKEVGGDFYDFFLLDEGRMGMVMADVSGKGIPAALFMMGAKTEIRACMESGMGLVESILTANYQLCQGNDAGMFVTVFAAVLDYGTGRIEYVNAGHNPPLVRHDGQWTWLRGKSGLFLGAYTKLKLTSRETELAPGDAILLYTDGVTEAWSADEKLYGEESLEAFLNAHADLRPRLLCDAIRLDLDRWSEGVEQTDDITLMCLEFGTPPLSTDTIEVRSHIDELERVTAFVNDELVRRLCPLNVQNKIDICLEELFVNVASYAYGEGSGRVWVTYVYLPDPQGMKVEISDMGTPFDPLAREDPEAPASVDDMEIGGLGIFMTKNMADEITYEYRDGCNVTTFEIHWAADDDVK